MGDVHGNGIAGLERDDQAALAMAKIVLDLTPSDSPNREQAEVKVAELTAKVETHRQATAFVDAMFAFFKKIPDIAAQQRAEWQSKPVAYRHNACVSACASRHNGCVSSNNSNAMWAHLGAAGGSPMVAGLAAGAIRNCGVSDSMCMPSCMDSGP